VSRSEAENKLALILAEIANGVWAPPAEEALADEAPTPEEFVVPTFEEWSNAWWDLNQAQWRPSTRADYLWRLNLNLAPAFGSMPVNTITNNKVKLYIAEKQAENKRIREAAAKGEPLKQQITDKRGRTYDRPLRPLSDRSINMTVTLLGAILQAALDDDEIGEHMRRNVARGARAKGGSKPRRSYLETSGQIAALLDAAGELDKAAKPSGIHIERRAMLTTLTFAGLRISELLALRRRDVDLTAGWIAVEDSKTESGVRKVKIRGVVRDELQAVLERRKVAQDGYVFATATGKRMGPDNFRNRVLTAAVKRANANLEAAGQPLLKDGLTPHSLRRTFCSVLYALGEDPGVVMEEMGHKNPNLALAVYRQAMRRGEDEKARLKALAEGTSEPEAEEPAQLRIAA